MRGRASDGTSRPQVGYAHSMNHRATVGKLGTVEDEFARALTEIAGKSRNLR